MTSTLTAHPVTAAGTSQVELILARLQETPGKWVAMHLLGHASGAYAVHSRISDLRRQGHVIEHTSERHGHACHSFYRLVS